MPASWAGPRLHAVQELRVGRHGVVLACQLGEQPVVGVQVVGIQVVAFVPVFLLVLLKQGGVVLPVGLHVQTAVGQLPVVVVDLQQAFVLGQFAVQKLAFFLHGQAGKLRPHGAPGDRRGLAGGGAGAHPQKQQVGGRQYRQQHGEHPAAPHLAQLGKEKAHIRHLPAAAQPACPERYRPPESGNAPLSPPCGQLPLQGSLDCRKSSKSVAAGGHVPPTATPTGKFCGKLCARSMATSARFAVKILSKGCGAERRLRRMQRGGAGAVVAECKRRPRRAA